MASVYPVEDGDNTQTGGSTTGGNTGDGDGGDGGDGME